MGPAVKQPLTSPTTEGSFGEMNEFSISANTTEEIVPQP